MNRLDTARAITLRRPWSHLVAHYGKNIENRGWQPYRGVDTLLIHAGKGTDPTPEFMRRGDWGDPHESAIVAVARLAGVCGASRGSDAVVCDCGRWAVPFSFHWQLADIVTLPEPVPAVGHQGLWRPDDSTSDAVLKQLSSSQLDVPSSPL